MAETKEPAGAKQAGPLSHAEVRDEADNTTKGPGPDLSGKRVRAIPAKGGTTVVVDARDFRNNGIEHPQVVFDFRKDKFTVAVGKDKGLTKEAADFLTKNYPSSFEYLEQ